jgi:hypothetical protein
MASEDAEEWLPPPQLVRLALGLESPTKDVGLAVVGDIGDALSMADEEHFALVRHKLTGQVGGSLFRFRGITLLCTWDHPVHALLPLGLDHIQGRSAMWHPNELNQTPENVAVRFDWSGNFRPDDKTKKLRTRYPGAPR